MEEGQVSFCVHGMPLLLGRNITLTLALQGEEGAAAGGGGGGPGQVIPEPGSLIGDLLSIDLGGGGAAAGGGAAGAVSYTHLTLPTTPYV